MTPSELASRIDQTLLKPTVGLKEGSDWLDAHAQSGFAALCVAPFLVPLAAQRLAGTGTAVCSVVGFPLGYSATETKSDEASKLVELGCEEIDMVMNLGAFLEGEDRYVVEDIAAVVEAVRVMSGGHGLVKVIVETGYLDPSGVERAARLCVEAGADFVKTSTGFGPRGASVEDVLLIREAVGAQVGVKAAGGIRDLETALAMLEAGADRLGTSSGDGLVAALERDLE
ncbi:MAG: deoxyribose-phosphate aldolase [Coriobacteriia bacterium]